MANNNVEVEIKTRVMKSDFVRVEKYIKNKFEFVKSSHQVDTYYSPAKKLFLKPKYPYEWLSIRKRDDKIVLNYKHWYPEGHKVTTHCDEYESKFENSEQLEIILKVLNFEKLVTVEKTRNVYKNGDFEIALDNVKGLGYFIEIESINNIGGVKRAHKNILNFAKLLNIDTSVFVPGGYAAEMMRRKGLMKLR